MTSPQEHHFPCDQCGSDLRFEPEAGILQCDHCGSQQNITEGGPWGHLAKQSAFEELDFNAARQGSIAPDEAEIRTTTDCPNCGARFEFAKDTHAAECPFCATPIVLQSAETKCIKPRAVLPFALSEKTAHEAMNNWLGRLWFAPNGLKEYARKGRKMNGIYVPYWTYDANTRSQYSGERGDVYYETRTVIRDGKPEKKRVARTDWSPARGRVARFFDDILVLGSQSLPKKYTDALQPWDLSQLEPYRPEFLAGFSAESYQVTLEDGFEEARAYMDRVIARDVRFDIGGDKQRIHHIDTDISDVTFKHLLLPVWLAAYKYRGKTYRFVVNGATGRVQGERPYSAWKIAIAVLLGLALAAAIGYGAALQQGQI